VIVGLTRGTGFVDITDPETPEILAEIPDEHSTWSDMAVYRQYAYNVNEAGGGMQIIDLSEIDQGIVTLVDSFTQDGLQTAHNVFVNTTSGFAYLCGANSPTSGLVAVDVRQPDSPSIAGVWAEAYAHDVYVDSYEDCPYAGRTGPCEIAFVFAGGQGVKIVDATLKTDMVTISTITYPNLGYCHQGWLGKDRRYLFFADESDERVFDLTTTTHVVDVRDVGDPQYLFAFTNGRGSIDHNLMVRGRFVFEANYTSGLRVYDVGDLDNVREVAFFDTHPGDNQPDFRGAWGVFAGFPSGLVAVSDMQRGLFVLAPCLPHNTLPNDLDGNGRVDLRDFRHLQRCFGPAPLDSGCQAVDTDCDGDVDLDDFSEFLDSLGPVPLLWSSATRP
jgi:choice-of-anchor B domain-containing protein